MEKEDEGEHTANKGKCINLRSLGEEYKLLADLNGFENLRALIKAEAFIKKRKRNNKQQKNVEALHKVTSSEDGEFARMEKEDEVDYTASKGNCVTARSLDEEYKLLADLSGFENLRALIKAEACMKKRKINSKQQKSVEALHEVNTEKEEKKMNNSQDAEMVSLETESGLKNSNSVFGKLLVNTAKEEKKTNKSPDTEMVSLETESSLKNSNSLFGELVNTGKEEKKVNNSQDALIGSLEAESSLKNSNSVFVKLPVNTEKEEKKMNNSPDTEMVSLETESSLKNSGSVFGILLVNTEKEEKKTNNSQGVEMVSMGTESDVKNSNFVFRKLLRGPRYFDPPEHSSFACRHCGEGHTVENCTAQKRKRPCSLCGSSRHIRRRCKLKRNCFSCRSRGHLARDCPHKDQEDNPSGRICLRCGDSGHDMFSCSIDYSLDDLKEIQCYVCKSFGHLCCVDSASAVQVNLSCYSCGQSGHLGLVCKKTCRDTSRKFRSLCRVEREVILQEDVQIT